MAMPRWWRPLAVLPRRPESPSRYSSERSGTFLSRHFHNGRGGSGLRNRVAILANAAEVYFHCRSDVFPDFSFGLPGRAASEEASAAVQGDRPTKPMPERLPESSRYPTTEKGLYISHFDCECHGATQRRLSVRPSPSRGPATPRC